MQVSAFSVWGLFYRLVLGASTISAHIVHCNIEDVLEGELFNMFSQILEFRDWILVLHGQVWFLGFILPKLV